jgi:hypothetical protein
MKENTHNGIKNTKKVYKIRKKKCNFGKVQTCNCRVAPHLNPSNADSDKWM